MAFSTFHYANPVNSVEGSGTYEGQSVPYTKYKYEGGFIPSMRPSSSLWTPANIDAQAVSIDASGQYSSASAYAHGATAWNRFRPGNPSADLGVFLGEFKDIPRMLKTTAKGFHDVWKSMGGRSSGPIPKKLANHWLNTQFGWLPFINDLRKFHKTYVSTDLRIKQIRRDNGHWVRHGGTLDSSISIAQGTSSSTLSAHYPVPTAPLLVNPSAPGSYTNRSITEQRVWFEGVFRYWIPNIDSVEWSNRVLLDLYGAFPNPSLVWELTPWSWLADWVSNLGDIVSNMTPGWAQNLAAKYAFVMKHTLYSWELESTLKLKGATLHNCWTFPLEWKMRSPACPFGFGLSSIDFTARQWSILSALGLSRLAYR